MTGTQMLIAISIVTGAWLIVGVGKPIIKENHKTKRQELITKEMLAKTDAEKAYYKETQETLREAVDLIKQIYQAQAEDISNDENNKRGEK